MNVDLWLHNVLAFSLQVTALTAIGTILPLALRLRHPVFLLRYWQALLSVSLLLPFLQPWRSFPTKNLSVNPLAIIQIQTRVELANTSQATVSLPKMLAVALLLGASARLMCLVLGFFRLRLYVQRAHRLSPIPEGVAEMCRVVAVNPKICVSTEIRSAVAIGFWPPMILVPPGFAEMPPDFQRAIICHELWHVRRKDWLFTVFEELILAILWFHPAMWWIIKTIQLSREQVIDYLVVKTTCQRRIYLDALMCTALAQNRMNLTFAPPFLTKHLNQRVTSILTEVTMSRTRIAVAVVISLSLLLPTGLMATRAFPLESPSSEVQGAAPQPVLVVLASQTIFHLQVATLVSISTEDLGKRLVRKVNPIYPPDAKKQGVQGEVLLAVSVSEKGEVDSINVLKGPAPLVLSALDAVKQWRYSPYLKGGAATPVESTVIVNFSLTDSVKTQDSTPEPTTIRLGEKVMASQLVSRVNPAYPAAAKEKGVQGEVTFDVTIDERGEVIDVQVLSGNAMLVTPAYEAVRQWRYEPVLLNGTPVRAKANVSIQFSLN